MHERIYPTGYIVINEHNTPMIVAGEDELHGGDQWLIANGSPFDPNKYPELLKILQRPRPKFSWRHPIQSYSDIIAWKAGDRMVYGGTVTNPLLPDMRSGLDRTTMTVPVRPPS